MSQPLALVTGASSGIGLALATELASRGYVLVICSAGERLQTASETISHVYAHSATTKLEGAVANFVRGSVKAAMHERMAKPKAS